ncbi:MAG: class I SAM-dependent methyltransferase [Novosphingobium sp.]
MTAPSSTPSIFDLPGRFLQMGLVLVSSGRGSTAVELGRQLARERPGDPRLKAMANAFLASGIPGFHRGMLADEPRNGAYRQAIERMAPGRRVLDLGTGSGLLAMMAARAGAAHVYACEANPMLATTARDIVAVNGLADRITIIPQHSAKLDAVRDLGGGVDLVVSEIFSDNVVGEGVLPALDHAARVLTRPGAAFLPASATIRCALIDITGAPAPVTTVEGFDLSLLNRHFARSEKDLAASDRLALRSDPVDLFRFDFAAGASPADEGECRAELVSSGGRVSAIAQWLQLELAPGITYENAPGGDRTMHWAVRCVLLPEPLETREGETIALGGWHDAARLVLWAER